MDIAIIPARGGSKRIPRKNIKDFCGQPMISYSINAALNSGIFDKVIVSTDDEEIRDVSLNLGALVPFQRPLSLADDFTPTVPVVLMPYLNAKGLGWNINYVACIYATAPFIFIEDEERKEAIQSLTDRYIFPVCEFPAPVQRSLIRNDSGLVEPLDRKMNYCGHKI